MTTSPTPDPYQTLGVESDADAAVIKKAYRKLVLTCHPDKVTDESLREEKQEEFHRIQQAYETIGEPDNREKYDAEVKLKKLREERDKMLPRGTPAQARRVNVSVNIFNARPPPEFRSSSSSAKSAPSKGSANFKQYSADFSRSWEHNLPTRSKGYEEERKTRRSASEEKLKRDRDEARREQERRKDEDERRRQRRERDLREREREQREEKERELRDRARRAEKERREQERREREELDRIAKKARDREREREKEFQREIKRKQADEEKSRPKPKAYVEDASEDDDNSRRNRSKKSSKRDSPIREKSFAKRSSQSDEATREVPATAKYSINMAFASNYIGRPQIMTSKSSTARTDGSFSSPDYQNPFSSNRHVSGEAGLPKSDGIRLDPGMSSRTRSEMPSASPITENPPRLRKAYTTTHEPSLPPRIPLGRSKTMEPEYYGRSSGADRHRSSRERTSFDDDDYYRPKQQKTYRVRHDKGAPRVSEAFYKDLYPPSPGPSFPKVKYSEEPEQISTSKRYDEGHYMTSSYNAPSYTDYPTAAYGQTYVATN
ncbi:hypothetical protein BD289DRAFT_452929 [Coniella lustricola]|uniref:J domain-containing protein n=1 Tax=Coniella lustricola TaxID=2025994 RepID=A0A2T3A975_9PEZI|nr:hypothetical protein BD289DRAFT_452929 [Coniella lustricola]